MEEALPEPEATPEDKEQPSTNSSANPEPVSEAPSTAEEIQGEPAAVAVPCPESASGEPAGLDDLSQPPTSSEGNTEVLHVLHSTQLSFCHYTVVKGP